jgi:hypothetical protein
MILSNESKCRNKLSRGLNIKHDFFLKKDQHKKKLGLAACQRPGTVSPWPQRAQPVKTARESREACALPRETCDGNLRGSPSSPPSLLSRPGTPEKPHPSCRSASPILHFPRPSPPPIPAWTRRHSPARRRAPRSTTALASRRSSAPAPCTGCSWARLWPPRRDGCPSPTPSSGAAGRAAPLFPCCELRCLHMALSLGHWVWVWLSLVFSLSCESLKECHSTGHR